MSSLLASSLNPKQIYKDNWRSYLDLGFIPYPASRTGKNPVVPWKDDLPAPVSDDYEHWEEKYPDANIWLLIGNDHAVIDPDGDGAEEHVQSLNLPECPTSISGNKSIHRWFKVSSPLKPLKIQNGSDKTFLEFRTGSMGIMAPPSVHPDTGKTYEWKKGYSPWEKAFPELTIEIYEKIKALQPHPEPRPEPRMMLVQTGDNSIGSLDVEKYLSHYGIKFTVKPDKNRTIYALERCLFADQHTTKDVQGDSSIIQGQDGKLGYQCFHNHCAFKTWQDARQAISGDEKLAAHCQGYVEPSQRKERGLLLLDPAICEADQFVTKAIHIKRKILSWLTEEQIDLCSAWRGTGKSWWLMSMSDAITRELPFGPWKTENAVPVFYLDGEMAAYDVQERFKQLNFSASTSRKAPLFIYSDAYANSLGIPRANLLNPRWREALKKSLIEKQVKLFVIDNISSLAPGIEENSKFEWDPVNQWLLGLRFAGITSFLLHHVGKEGNQRGTSAREDNLDVSLVLQRPHDYVTEEGARFVVKFKKARVPTRELSLMSDVEFCLSEVEGRLQWTWNEVKRKNQVEILKMLDEGVPQKDIAQALCVTAGFVSQVKSKAIGDGHLSKTGKLTESGFLLVNSGEENEEIY